MIFSDATPAARTLRIDEGEGSGPGPPVPDTAPRRVPRRLGIRDRAEHPQAAFLFGSPSAIFGFLVTMWQDGSLFRDTYVTGLETVLGFVVGNVLGTVLGLSLWYSRFVSRVVQPFIVALGSIPIIALAPIVIIWFGTRARLEDRDVDAVGRGRRAGHLLQGRHERRPRPGQPDAHARRHEGDIFRKLVVPASLTDIFAGLKLTVGFALIGAIIGEFMSSSEGLGHAIFKAGSLYIIPKVFAALVVTIALALVLTYLVGKLERLLTPWRQVA